MLDSCKMVEKKSEAFHRFLWHSFQFKQNFIAYRVRLHFEFTSCDNQALVECIPIPAVAVSLNLKFQKFRQSSYKMYSNNILNFSRVYDRFKRLYKKSLETYWMYHVIYIYIYIYIFIYIYIWGSFNKWLEFFWKSNLFFSKFFSGFNRGLLSHFLWQRFTTIGKLKNNVWCERRGVCFSQKYL